jgi:hypothetical protein
MIMCESWLTYMYSACSYLSIMEHQIEKAVMKMCGVSWFSG